MDSHTKDLFFVISKLAEVQHRIDELDLKIKKFIDIINANFTTIQEFIDDHCEAEEPTCPTCGEHNG